MIGFDHQRALQATLEQEPFPGLSLDRFNHFFLIVTEEQLYLKDESVFVKMIPDCLSPTG